MNCLQSRRLLLAGPREQSPEHRGHISECGTCSSLQKRLYDLERSLQDAAFVPVPDALAHRILLRQRQPILWQYAAAAVVAIATTVGALVATDLVDTPVSERAVQAVGPTHPAVVAIAEVAEEDSAARAQTPDTPDVQQGLKRLGLTINTDQASVHYLGKCHVDGGTECERIVLSAPDAHANVMLVPDYPVGDRLLVQDRRMVALVSPAGSGAYIVVADSAKTAKRVEKLLVKG